MDIEHHEFCYVWGILQLMLLAPVSVVRTFSSCRIHAMSDYFILWSYGTLDLAWIRFFLALKLINYIFLNASGYTLAFTHTTIYNALVIV
jgi:hypothetical protein